MCRLDLVCRALWLERKVTSRRLIDSMTRAQMMTRRFASPKQQQLSTPPPHSPAFASDCLQLSIETPHTMGM